MLLLLGKCSKIYKRVFNNKPKFYRNKTTLGLWDEELTTDVKILIEQHWKKKLQNSIANNQHHNNEFVYVLPMFPYPSGNLHMGHVRVYSISDTLARLHSLFGKNVIHPIGWDAFGLPAENAAIENNIAPDKWTKSNVESMKKQLLNLAFDFDWNKEINTSSPNYYKWTQFIFLKLHENGLAYQSKASVNWDPVDQTVLADEQVDELGCSWRSGAKVEKKTLKQWFIKTTAFAKDLYDGLNSEVLDNWGDIVNLQRHWIGECNGITINFLFKIANTSKVINIWSADPYKFIHGEFIVIKSDSLLYQDITNKGLDFVSNNIYALNPLTNQKVHIYVTDNANYAEGRDIYIASPSTDEEDKKLALSLKIVTSEKSVTVDKVKDSLMAVQQAQAKNVGGYYVNSKLKDWLISRQRYWGTPIPMISCKKCGTVPVPYEDLPVELPKVNNFQTGIQTLANVNSWINCKCPKCGGDATRETDTMDTFVDSSWYYYRFLDPDNNNKPFDKSKLIGKAPVNIYVGGKEHAVLHLYYARFMSHFLHKLGWTPTPEPFKKLIVQGMVMGQSYKLKSCGKYIKPDTVYKDGKIFKEKETNEPVIVQWEKMSKSKYNGENPDNLLSKHGCDTTRLFMLADVPPGISRNWSEATFPGVLNWQRRLWYTVRDFLKYRNNSTLYKNNSISDEDFQNMEKKIFDSRNFAIATTTFIFKHTHKLSVGISRLQSLTSTLRSNVPPQVIARSKEFEKSLAYLVIMTSPLAPHFASELWAGLQSAPDKLCDDDFDWSTDVVKQKWPEVDDDYQLSFLCKIDGRDICDLKLNKNELDQLTQDTAMALLLKEPAVNKYLKGDIRKIKFDHYPGCRAILNIFCFVPLEKPKLKQQNTVGKMGRN